MVFEKVGPIRFKYGGHLINTMTIQAHRVTIAKTLSTLLTCLTMAFSDHHALLQGGAMSRISLSSG